MVPSKLVKLNDHLINTVNEGLLKLGTTGNESYAIYYDLDLLSYLLDQKYEDKEACLSDLQMMYKGVCDQDIKGNRLHVDVSMQKGRFRFTIPAPSMDYVRTHGHKNDFMADIIALVNTHHFDIEDVKHVFEKYSSNFTCEKTSHPEFDYVLYFNDNEINHYKYCFSFDGCGGFYHRLLDYDYQQII